MAALVNAITECIQTHGTASTYWLAYSGGLDSHVLLHLFAKTRLHYPIQLRAVYVNHGVSPNAEKWAAHCQKVCDELNISFMQQSFSVFSERTSPEDQLRELRYQLFENLLQPNDVLLTAHQQNDQAETVLLQLLRGAGPQGLSAMPRLKSFAKGFHARPLLEFSREDLKSYAEKNQLQWIEDESNHNTQFTRNFLRHEVIPILAKRWPSVAKTLARTAEHCASAQVLIDTATQTLLQDVQGHQPNTLSVKKLLLLDANQQLHVLRAWIYQNNFALPSTRKIQKILKDVLLARADKMPCVCWGEVELRRYRDSLFLTKKLLKHDATQIIAWDNCAPLSLKNMGELQPLFPAGQNVTVRFRQGGEKIQLPGRKHHHELKKLFQEWGVPPWLRDRIPLIYVEDVLIAVVGFIDVPSRAMTFSLLPSWEKVARSAG